jgi:serine/threonine protein phosphatase PrpC
LWDVITYQEATNLVLQLMESNNKEILTAQKVSDYLVNSAIRKNTFDNITVIVVKLK